MIPGVSYDDIMSGEFTSSLIWDANTALLSVELFKLRSLCIKHYVLCLPQTVRARMARKIR